MMLIKTLLGIAIVGGCASLLTLVQAQAQDLDSRLSHRFDALDKNGDGEIAITEAPWPGMIQRFDTDKNRKLSLEEFKRAVEVAIGRRGAEKYNAPLKPWTPGKFVAPVSDDARFSVDSILAAAEYSAAHKGVSFLVMHDGKIIYQDYPNGGMLRAAHELASGTKSFTGVLAMAAIEDGIIDSLDEVVSETITEWKSDPRKSKITVRQLLDLSSGIDPRGSAGKRVPSYAAAIANASLTEPGAKFNYGPAHFQCFGEFLKRKLISRGHQSPLAYLEERIFQPIGLSYARWRKDRDGNPHLPSGAELTAQNWAKFGELIRLEGTWQGKQVLDAQRLNQCFSGSPANPAYGLTFWLNKEVSQTQRRSIPQLRFGTTDLTNIKKIPTDLVYAAGAGKQRLYISRDAKLVVVRQAYGVVDALNRREPGGFTDVGFLTRFFDEDRLKGVAK